MKALFLIALGLTGSLLCGFTRAAVSDEWLLASQGKPWWYTVKPAPSPRTLTMREPLADEGAIVAKAKSLLESAPGARAIALVDGMRIVMLEFHKPASEQSIFHGFSMGKTVTSMAVGQAICRNVLSLETQAGTVLPSLRSRFLGQARVRDLLTMSSGVWPGDADGNIMSRQDAAAWDEGRLKLAELVARGKTSDPAPSLFSSASPGHTFAYKNTDPLVLGLMLHRATGVTYADWVQQSVFDVMGIAREGYIVQDQDGEAAADYSSRLHIDDWIRFAIWVREASARDDCFGNYVREASRTQIRNPGSEQTRRAGKLFGGYGYFLWTDNELAPHSYWAAGVGGQRIGWSRGGQRIILAFSTSEEWMPQLYKLAHDWLALH